MVSHGGLFTRLWFNVVVGWHDCGLMWWLVCIVVSHGGLFT